MLYVPRIDCREECNQQVRLFAAQRYQLYRHARAADTTCNYIIHMRLLALVLQTNCSFPTLGCGRPAVTGRQTGSYLRIGMRSQATSPGYDHGGKPDRLIIVVITYKVCTLVGIVRPHTSIRSFPCRHTSTFTFCLSSMLKKYQRQHERSYHV